MTVANSGTDNIGIFLNHANGTFDNQRLISTGLGSRPYAVGVGHFNNDTNLDLAVARYGLNSIGVYLGDGKGQFTSATITSLDSSRPLSLVVGHLNNDSALDIAVVNDGTLTVVILTGYNNGSFRFHSIYEMGFDSMPYSITIADLNEDRKVDLIVVNYGTSELVILLNDGNGNFSMEKYSTGSVSHPSSVVVGDFDNDKKLDIATANSASSNIGIFPGHGDGTFGKYITYSTGWNSRPQSLAIADINNDTLPDIIVVDSGTNNILVLNSTATGNLSIILSHSSGMNSQPLSLVVEDFDNDKKLDIAVVNNATNNILLLRSFLISPVPSYVNYSPGSYCDAYSVDIGDFNEDGHLDLVVPDSFNHYIYIFLNDGNEKFTLTKKYYTKYGSAPYSVSSSDVNNDHHVDVVVVLQRFHRIQIFLGYGNGTFRKGKWYSTEDDSRPCMAVVVDLNNDGKLDIIVSLYESGNIGIFFGFGNGNFAKMRLLLTTPIDHPKCVAVGDFNNDHIPDIAVPNSRTNAIVISLGYGNGSFQNPVITLVHGDYLACITIDDLNNDHHSDIVYAGTHVGVLLGNGNATFGHPTDYLTSRSFEPTHVTVGYYNNDALLDIVVSSSIDRSISLFMGVGNGSFGTVQRISDGYDFRAAFAKFVDLNNDNQQEIIVSKFGNEGITIISINYQADFTNESTHPTGSGPHPYSITTGDLNNDSQSDMIVVNSGNDNIELLLNYHKGIFVQRTIFSLDHGSHPQSVAIADFNKDQFLDLAVLNSWNDDINVFVRLKNGSFDSRDVYSLRSGSLPNSMVANDLNKDGRMDLVIANQGADNIAVFLAFDYIQFTADTIDISDLYAGPSYTIAADFNNDRRLDIAVSITNLDKIGIYLGYGNGSFSEQISCSTGHINWPTGLDVGHFNNDDNLDIVAAYAGFSGIGVFLGYGNGSFHSPIFYSSSPDENSSPHSVVVADFNNDTKLDIVVANNFDHNI